MRQPGTWPWVWEGQPARDQSRKAGECLFSRRGLEQSFSETGHKQSPGLHRF